MLNEEVNDTDPEIERVMIEFWRAAPAWRKLEQVAALNEMLDSLVLASIAKRYPDADEAEVRRRWAKRKLPHNLYREFFAVGEEKDE